MRYDLIENKISGETIKQDDYIAGLAKGLSLLEAFGIDRQKLNSTQVAERTGLSRTAARRYLRTLKYLGYLESDDHYFWLTHKVLRLSSSYLSSAHLPKVVQPILNLLSAQTGLTFSLVVLDEHEVVPIARSYLPQHDNLRVSPYGMHLGNRLPAHATSTGKVLLAALRPEEQKQWLNKYGLKRLTAYTIQDETQFYQILNQVQKQDYCLSKEEHEFGVIAIAVPVLNGQGDAVAALNCIAQTHRMTDEQLLQQILPLLRNTAYELRCMI
ncbi:MULTISPECIES: IclR family transcriptional regulator domain-containing protein [Acinetobacter]|jgi:IclR family pca regulon transcriptional regulator|uniref:IclR family transcriptional regulator domain-containing protein n=1 Tax=Acinetobacter TaxID=469 RepID=UPI0018DD53DE|nr:MULTISPECIES: IclR family transcriptional regulator C-terminal domain-containing protein [Acinetobacter]MBI0394443.1 helix-turn-helix domain-containing protein [Acinetobacter bereziniae]MBJ8442280.1 helix-turn-helix domain-containing protein [Acinetobacter bereziniae]MCM8510965.1 helix-turn-helix domain-containing protein [Acinetobacter bereziniae]MDR3029690.1 helix-turn-helix domain-containing protein [Acinetobacter sp.]MDV8155268.1 IclR family transcriptional regulator C-terminal domain-c